MNDRPLVLYHASCADGFGSALAAWLAFKDRPPELVPVQYGQAPPDVTDREVYVLDFSYKLPVMSDMVRRAKSLVVIDHHKTAEEDLKRFTQDTPEGAKLSFLSFDLNKSGAVLAWEYFFCNPFYQPCLPVPELFLYLQDRDLWRWEMPDSREVSAAIQSHPFDLNLWKSWLDGWHESFPLLVDEGRAILRYQDRLVGDHVGHAREVEIAGHRVLAVNATCLVSEVAGRLAEGRPFGVCYFRTEDGKWVWSLRSRDGGVDVSEVAKLYGGGGHRNAAGCTRDTPP